MAPLIKNIHATSAKVRLVSGHTAAVIEFSAVEGLWAVHLPREALEGLVSKASRELARGTPAARHE